MRELLASNVDISYLDANAKRFLAEGCKAYRELGFDHRVIVDTGRQFEVFTWLGDAANEAVACLINQRGMQANVAGPCIEVYRNLSGDNYLPKTLCAIALSDTTSLDVLLADAMNLEREKWDWVLRSVGL